MAAETPAPLIDTAWVAETRATLRRLLDEVSAQQDACAYPTELASVYIYLDHADEWLEGALPQKCPLAPTFEARSDSASKVA